MITLGLLLAQAGGQITSRAIDVFPSEAQLLFDKGFAEAEHVRDENGIVNRFRRGIGNIRVNALGKTDTVSFFWVYPPRLLAYVWGFQCRKKFEPDEKVKEYKDKLLSGIFDPMKRIRVEFHIRLLPSTAGLYGKVSRHANPKDLEDVRVVMKIGEHIYQPVDTPGNLLQKEGVGDNRYSTPAQSTTTVEGRYNGSNGYGWFDVSQTNFYQIRHDEGFRWYEGQFVGSFDMFNPDGLPRLTSDDKKIEFIVVYGSNERHAEYDVNDFIKM